MAPARWTLWQRQGTVSLEVALLFPLAVLVLVGFAEAYLYVRASAIVERVAAAVAESVSKRTTLIDCIDESGSSYLGTHLWVATETARPLDLVANGQVIVSAVRDVSGTARVAWQRRSAFTRDVVSVLGTVGAAAALPGGLTVKAVAGPGPDVLIVAEVVYVFQPFAATRTFMPDLPLDVTIARQAYFRARTGALATLATSPSCAGLPSP